MGDEMSAFLIDARFLLRNTTETFWGASLIVVDGKDNTFCFGFCEISCACGTHYVSLLA
jgi:hypothetical protein